MSILGATITFSHHSTSASSVIQVHQGTVTDIDDVLGANDVLIAFIASPINPQDLAVIAGRYPVQPSFHVHHHHHHPAATSSSSSSINSLSAIPGYDGAARVLRVGASVAPNTLAPGDLVVPARHGLGTWRTHATVPADWLVRVPRSLDPVAAALLRMAFCPAYLLLEDHHHGDAASAAGHALRPGDWIVLNAAGGAIARLLAQFARMRGCRTLGVVRDASVFSSSCGGDDDDDDDAAAAAAAAKPDVIVTEADLAARGASVDPSVEHAVKQGRFVLALDAVFGESGEHIAKLLAPGATFVAYGFLGGASGAAIRLTPELLFWKHVTFKNFRLSDALAQRSAGDRKRLLKWFAELVEEGRIILPPVEAVVLSGKGENLEETVKNALERASGKTTGVKKQVFMFNV